VKTAVTGVLALVAAYCGFWAAWTAVEGEASSFLWLVISLAGVLFAFLTWAGYGGEE
jgi:hypothetical protein